MSQFFVPFQDNRTPEERTIHGIVTRAIATERETLETIAAAIRKMEQTWTESRNEFWNGAVPVQQLVNFLGTNASQFFSDSYALAERMRSMGSKMFDIVDDNGRDVSRNEQGFLIAALPPKTVRRNADGTITILDTV